MQKRAISKIVHPLVNNESKAKKLGNHSWTIFFSFFLKVEITDSTPSPPATKDVTKRLPPGDTTQVSTEPAWLALAKRKAKAWSDCPQIIKWYITTDPVKKQISLFSFIHISQPSLHSSSHLALNKKSIISNQTFPNNCFLSLKKIYFHKDKILYQYSDWLQISWCEKQWHQCHPYGFQQSIIAITCINGMFI